VDKQKDRNLLRKVLTELTKLRQDPYAGKQKKQDLRGVWGWEFTDSGIHYRIAYTLNEEEHHLAVLFIGPHESFWDEVKDYWRIYKKTIG